jgi:SNF2 family DNA or RNA helicase
MAETSNPIIRLTRAEPGKPMLDYRDGKLIVRYPRYQSSLVSLSKEIGGRFKRDPIQPESKTGARSQVGEWRFPAYIAYANAITESVYGLETTDEFKQWQDSELVVLPEADIPPNILPVWRKLYPFQQEAVTQLVMNPWDHPGCLLALSPGLGKTVVALTAAGILQLPRVLIIAPLSLLNVWRLEKAKWFPNRNFQPNPNKGNIPYDLSIVHGSTPPETGWVVTNYNTVTSPRRVADFCEQSWDAIILDESVHIKNRKTQRFYNIKTLRDSADLIWLLSGSPITRTPADLCRSST